MALIAAVKSNAFWQLTDPLIKGPNPHTINKGIRICAKLRWILKKVICNFLFSCKVDPLAPPPTLYRYLVTYTEGTYCSDPHCIDEIHSSISSGIEEV